MATVITLDMIRDAVIAEANLMPEDYVYVCDDGTSKCRYELDGKAQCLIGRALLRLGVPINVLNALDLGWKTIVAVGAVNILKDAGFEWEQDAVEWARVVQFYQDAKHPWRQAISIADNHLAGRS